MIVPPEFGKSVVDILAKRAAQMCSNTNCRVITAGPADDPQKAINVGEAAHIYGAREGAARFRDDMTDTTRAAITNAIWLCRNCHKLVDSDPTRFPAELLFRWRTEHERLVLSKLERRTDLIEFDIQLRESDQFWEDSPLARQIVLDRPSNWEYRLTAELLRGYLKAPIKIWRDLRDGLYSRPATIVEPSLAGAWFGAKTDEVSRLAGAIGALYSQELGKACGNPGESGDPLKIRHVCKLIGAAADEIVRWEESVRFASVQEPYTKLFGYLFGTLGGQLDKLAELPRVLDDAVDWSDVNPGIRRDINYRLTLKVPDGWLDRVQSEVKVIARRSRC